MIEKRKTQRPMPNLTKIHPIAEWFSFECETILYSAKSISVDDKSFFPNVKSSFFVESFWKYSSHEIRNFHGLELWFHSVRINCQKLDNARKIVRMATHAQSTSTCTIPMIPWRLLAQLFFTSTKCLIFRERFPKHFLKRNYNWQMWALEILIEKCGFYLRLFFASWKTWEFPFSFDKSFRFERVFFFPFFFFLVFLCASMVKRKKQKEKKTFSKKLNRIGMRIS